ncbi:hypothetical protein [Haloflavibacter putidus]|uniref:Uncharacterized protein n=1 Tax=Haloflavibacter putidus TaxID=2576776 RepID=A0A508A056_9FLAO|nr:hypothetical protein [Haloflavibacter putidus]TQD40295.1 hypothetical protein FKR84_03600 [Haloflavibacter putidus]
MQSCLVCSKLKSSVKTIVYIQYISNSIDRDKLINYRKEYSYEYLLNQIFVNSDDNRFIKKEYLRALTGLNDKSTFNKYFRTFLKKNNLEKRRKFSIREVYSIIKFWQGEGNFLRIEPFTKMELAKRFTKGNYEMLSTNFFIDPTKYRHHDFLSPKMVKQNINEFIKVDCLEKEKFLEEEDLGMDYLKFCYMLFVWGKVLEKLK